MTTNDNPAGLILQRIFDVIVEEARSNPGFADKLIEALADRVAAGAGAAGKKAPKLEKEVVLLTRLFNREGEEALRAFLKGEKPAKLRELVKRQQIPVDAAALKGQGEALHNAIVDGVKLRIADRLAAAS
jgi:ATP phosphoribosyltransferase regulatory subunit HisZ